MVLSVVREAHSVLELTASGAKKAAKSVQPVSHRFSHWSTYVLLINGGVAIATALAVAIMGLHAFAIVISLTAVCSFIGAFYLRRFAIAQGLNTLVQMLTTKLKELHTNITALQATNQGLDNTVIDLKKEREREAKERKASLDQMAKNTNDLKDAVKQLENQKADLEKAAKTFEDGKVATEIAYKRAQKYLDMEIQMRDRTSQLCHNNKKLIRDLEQLWANVGKIKEIPVGLDQTASQLNQTQLQWAIMFNQLVALCQAKDRLIKQLSIDIGRLSITDKQLTALVSQTNANTKDLGGIVSKMAIQVQNDRNINALLSKLMQQKTLKLLSVPQPVVKS